MLDIGSIHEMAKKQIKKKCGNSILVFVTNGKVGHFGYVEKDQCLTLKYVISKLQMITVKQEEYVPNYDYEVRVAKTQANKKIDAEEKQKDIVKDIEIAHKKQVRRAGAKLDQMVDDARLRLAQMCESTTSEDNEKEWALFLFRKRNAMPDAKLPKSILSRQSFLIATSIHKKKNVEWIQQEPVEIVPTEFNPQVKSALFEQKIK